MHGMPPGHGGDGATGLRVHRFTGRGFVVGVPPEVSAPRWGMRPEAPPVRRPGESRTPWVVSLIVAAAGALLAITSILVTAGSSGYTTMHHPSGGMAPTIPADSDVTVRNL